MRIRLGIEAITCATATDLQDSRAMNAACLRIRKVPVSGIAKAAGALSICINGAKFSLSATSNKFNKSGT